MNENRSLRKSSIVDLFNIRKHTKSMPPESLEFNKQQDRNRGISFKYLPCKSINETNKVSKEMRKLTHTRKFSSNIAATIRSTFRRNSLASLHISNESSSIYNSPSLQIRHENVFDSFKLISPTLVAEQQEQFTNKYVDSSIKFDEGIKASKISSSVKKTMSKRFSTAKVALRKLSLSSITMTHGVSLANHKENSLQYSTSVFSSPFDSLQISTTGSPVKNCFFDQKGVIASNEENYIKKDRTSSTRVFRKKSATEALLKRSLGPSLSWDLEQRSRSVNSRFRIHSDGSENSQRNIKKNSISINDSDLYEQFELVHTCLHCRMGAEHRHNQLRYEIETALKRLSKRLNIPKYGSLHELRRTNIVEQINFPPQKNKNLSPASSLNSTDGANTLMISEPCPSTPDIIVSSFISDDEFFTQNNNICSGSEKLSFKGVEQLKQSTNCGVTKNLMHYKGNNAEIEFSPSNIIKTNKIDVQFQPCTKNTNVLVNKNQNEKVAKKPVMESKLPLILPFGNTYNFVDSNMQHFYFKEELFKITDCKDETTNEKKLFVFFSNTGENLIVNQTSPDSLKQRADTMDTLKLPDYCIPICTHSVTETDEMNDEMFTLGSKSAFSSIYTYSPSRSSSIDLSTLRRDIELLSISSTTNSNKKLTNGINNIIYVNIPETNNDNKLNEPLSTSPVEFLPASIVLGVRTNRSRSHDPTECPEHPFRRPSRIEHLSEIFRKALAKSPVVKRAAAMQEHERRRVSKHRTSRYWLDEQLKPAEHIWLPSSSGTSNSNSNDTECYIGENDCEKFGEKRQCAACHIVAHTACFPILSKMNLLCKTTFRDCVVPKRQSSTETNDALIRHHWVHRWKLEGRCQHCSKSFQQKIFREKEVIAITCSWCKKSYHNKRSCFSIERFDERCDRGQLSDLILPPEWLLRLSNRKRHTKTSGSNPGKKLRRKYRPFVVKPTDILRPLMPLLVFVNPKSGGNKGHKALNTLCWLLNPRQVFDITVLKGPKYGLEVFRNVANKLRILVAGGDGTVGWVLSTLDQLNWPVYPPMALVPLGTGNDLSRSMGWGGVFSDEPLSEILSAILHETTFTYLDRWQLDVQPNKLIPAPVNAENDEHSQSFNNALKLPLTVMNNYFSIGADAHVALQFHHSRSANPQMLNSRLKNRIAYGGLGTIDLFKRTWKDLTEYMTLECDDVDFTWKIREMKVHCVLFHNINYYAGGTIPWGEGADSGEYLRPSLCDGKIEVLGFTTATLAALQMGGKGQIIAQCSKIRIQTTKAIPMQVDGEPCLLGPSIIKLIFHSKVPMLRREKNSISTPILNMRRQSRVIMTNVKKTDSNDDLSFNNMIIQMHVPVIVVGRYDFDTYRDSIERLRDTGFELGVISVETEMELVIVRAKIQRLLSEHPMLPYEPKKDWRFIDYVSNAEEGTFRVSRHVERANIISDICNINECILIQDDAFPSITYRSAAITFAPTASGKMSLDSLSRK